MQFRSLDHQSSEYIPPRSAPEQGPWSCPRERQPDCRPTSVIPNITRTTFKARIRVCCLFPVPAVTRYGWRALPSVIESRSLRRQNVFCIPEQLSPPPVPPPRVGSGRVGSHTVNSYPECRHSSLSGLCASHSCLLLVYSSHGSQKHLLEP